MANLKSTRGAQWPLMVEFTVDVSTAGADGMPTVIGNVIGGAAPAYNGTPIVLIGSVGANIFDIINLPPNATVIGGELIVEIATVGPTVATVAFGDQNSATRYLGATSTLAAARTALTLTGYRGVGENIRMSTNFTVAPSTAGKFTVRVLYTVQSRQNESQPN